MSAAKKVKYQSIHEQSADMSDFLQHFPVSESNIGEQIARLENDICAIRSSLEKMVKKITISQLNTKLDYIINALTQRGITYTEPSD